MNARFTGTERYIATEDLMMAVNAAITLARPLLIKGEPGTGKTQLAQEIARSLDCPLYEWHIKSTSKAQQGLYEYDAVSRLRDSQLGDARVQDIVRQLFRTFAHTGSATATVKAFRDQGLQFPHRIYGKTNKGDVLWSPLEHTRVLWVLHHPRYAGAYCFGRARTRRMPDGRERYARLPPEDWIALIRDAHEAYITWEEHEQNLQRLRQNAQALGDERQRGAPREGPALLQGLAVCAICGERMTIRYHIHGNRRVPDYVCQRRGIRTAQPKCQLMWPRFRGLLTVCIRGVRYG